ncbi:hypothetical protein [Streptomyces sp. NBC_01361]|uniref:hypothetical protein n=1 Tax=Streptomyces sp. NBC_01361 TaxID=2903838 RepID=UPI002E32B6AF|nr:hypothetical protein [Streptomyces sp. NBC_01361]
MKAVLPVRQMLVRAVDQMLVRAVDACDARKALPPRYVGTDLLKEVDGINYLKGTHVRLEMPRREDVFMSKVANCCAEHGVLSLEEKTLPVSTGDPCARVLCDQFAPVTRGLQLSVQQLRPWHCGCRLLHPPRSGGITVLVDHSAEPVSAAYSRREICPGSVIGSGDRACKRRGAQSGAVARSR